MDPLSPDFELPDYRHLFELSGKVAVVTGGCGILGRHFCAALAGYGASVVVVDLDPAACEALAARLEDRFGVPCLGVACDVSRLEQVQALTARVLERFGQVDVLLNNAAGKPKDMNRYFTALEDYPEDIWREVMAVNVDGLFLVARALGAEMAKRGRGSIIQTASIYGVAAPDQRIYEGASYEGRAINTPAVYSTSKAAVIGLTRHLATWWGSQGVRVNSLTPGGIESGQNETFKQRYGNRVPMGRMGQARELIGAVIWLASDASSYVTGQNIIVDGGLTCW
jgi:NAD(P)-dependent dehydrogenase (short-subunit alcohol dehydrogenase family)